MAGTLGDGDRRQMPVDASSGVSPAGLVPDLGKLAERAGISAAYRGALGIDRTDPGKGKRKRNDP